MKAAAQIRGERGSRAILAELAPSMGLDPDLRNLEFVEEKHGLGSSRSLFRQMLDGLPVHDANVSVNQGADGSLQAIYSTHRNLSPGRNTPGLTSAEAEALAFIGPAVESLRQQTASELVWYSPTKGVANLAWKLLIYSRKPLGDFLTLVDAQSGKILLQENRIAFETGSGLVFMPNPVQTSGDGRLMDENDENTAILNAERVSVELLGLDPGVGTLKGEFVDLVSLPGGKGRPDADEMTRVYNYRRSNPRFEQVVVYHTVDSIQRYFHELGFDDDEGIANGIRDFPTLAHAHWENADQSFYSVADDAIHFGDGGVDDAEDADIIAHEYGHAVQHDQNACWGGGEMAAMGEGFGDYLAASFFADDGNGLHQGAHAACVGEWDASSYSGSTPPCLRRVDEDKLYRDDWTDSPHADGEIWSRALWDIRSSIGGVLADQLILEHHFTLPCGASMTDAALEMLQADANLHLGANEASIRQAFCDRGILSGEACVDPSGLMLDLRVVPDPPLAGQKAVLTLTATNPSADALAGVSLRATIPAGSTFVSDSASDGGSESLGFVHWPAAEILAGEEIQRHFEILLAAGPGSIHLLSDDMETGESTWVPGHLEGTVDWVLGPNRPYSGTLAYFASEPDAITDQLLTMQTPVAISDGTQLRFWHDYDLEAGYDGAVVEISVDGGFSWTDLGDQFVQNSYNEVISTSFSSPIGGRAAFGGNSQGYLESVVDLGQQAGQDVLIRFRMTSDSSISGNGWYLDDVWIGSRVILSSNVQASGGAAAAVTLELDVQGAPRNTPPVILVNSGLAVNEHTSAPITSAHLRVIDADPDDPLTFVVTSAPSHGVLSLGASFSQEQIDQGLLGYSHDGSETLEDSFRFFVDDGNGHTTPETLFSIVANPVNDSPTAAPDELLILEGGLTTTLSDGVTQSLLANDSDPDGPADSLTATLITPAIHGNLVLSPDGTFSYDHDGSETTEDSFSYSVSDGTATGNTTTASISIVPVNDIPVLMVNSGLTVAEGGSALVDDALLAVLDTDGVDTITYSITSVASVGNLSLGTTFTQAQISSSELRYTHNGSETDADFFTFTASDGNGGQIGPATFVIVVTPTNDPPELGLSVLPDAVVGGQYEVDFIPSDPDPGDILSVSWVSAPSWLAPPIENSDGSWTLFGLPRRGDEGQSSVLLKVTDSATPAAEQQASISLLIHPAAVSVPALGPWALGLLMIALAGAGSKRLARDPGTPRKNY